MLNAGLTDAVQALPAELQEYVHRWAGRVHLADGPELMDAINKAIDTYGRSERNKYRAVVYYILTKHFGKESVYG